jgi:hypothetical protein
MIGNCGVGADVEIGQRSDARATATSVPKKCFAGQECCFKWQWITAI